MRPRHDQEEQIINTLVLILYHEDCARIANSGTIAARHYDFSEQTAEVERFTERLKSLLPMDRRGPAVLEEIDDKTIKKWHRAAWRDAKSDFSIHRVGKREWGSLLDDRVWLPLANGALAGQADLDDEPVVQQLVIDLRVLDCIRAAERTDGDVGDIAIPPDLESAIAPGNQWIEILADGDPDTAAAASKLVSGRMGLSGRSHLAVTDAMFEAAGSVEALRAWATPQQIATWQNDAWQRAKDANIDLRVSHEDWDESLASIRNQFS